MGKRTPMRVPPRLLLTLLLALAAIPVRAANPDALWHIVHDRCVPDQQANNAPAPCEKVDMADGDAVLKDIEGDTQFLLIPTSKVTGMEDPAILAPGAPNYFAAAWQARDLVSRQAHQTLPREDIALAVNSAYARTQNQLHIHIDCLRPEVIAAVRAHAATIGTVWTPLPGQLLGHPYLARSVTSADLSEANPFTLLANGVPGAKDDMGHWTLVAAPVSVDGAPGFLLLADHVDLTIMDRAGGEELQDHACIIKSGTIKSGG
jgi:CDP-diacylglycerol pyrophosphatase